MGRHHFTRPPRSGRLRGIVAWLGLADRTPAVAEIDPPTDVFPRHELDYMLRTGGVQ